MTRKAARPLDRDSALPLWAQLHRDLVRRLAAGAFVKGFPGEHELVGTYGVSRYTVREALRRLREDGAISSARGRPTTVRDGRIEQPLGSLYSLFREVEARGMVQASTVLAQRMDRSPTAAAVLGLPGGADLLYLERLRLADGTPLAHDVVWLPGDFGTALLSVDLSRGALYDELAARRGIHVSGGRETITAVVPNPRQRDLLAVPRGVACLAIERTGMAGAEVVEYRRTLVRADRFAVVAEWSARGYSLGAAPTRPVQGRPGRG